MLQRNNRGSILLNGTLLLAAILLAAITTFLAFTSIRYRAAHHKEKEIQARLWAESGISDAANRLRHDPFWRADGSESYPILMKTYGEEGYAVHTTMTHAPNGVRLTSEGWTALLRRKASQDLLLDIPTLFALIAKEEIRLSDDVLVSGSVMAGENVTLGGNAKIQGTVQTGKSFIGQTNSVFGAIHENFSEVRYPNFDLTSYPSSSAKRLSSGQFTNVSFNDTDLFITGSADVTGLTLMNGTLIVEGDLRVLGPLQIECPDGMFSLIVTGNLTVEERGQLFIKGPVYVGNAFRSRGQGRIGGTVIAKSVDLASNIAIHPLLESVYRSVPGLKREVVRLQYREEP